MFKDQPNSWGKSARFHGRVFKMYQISRKEFEKFTENSRAPQPLFRGAILMQTKKSVEYSTFEISEQQIFIIVINVLSQD